MNVFFPLTRTTAKSSTFTSVRKLSILLLIGDLSTIVLSLSLTYFLQFREPPNVFGMSLISIAIFLVLSLYITGTYNPNLNVGGMWASVRALISCLFVGLVLSLLTYLFRAWAYSPMLWRSVLLPGLGLFTLWAVLSRWAVTVWSKSQAKQISCLMLGGDDRTLQFEQDFTRWNPLGIVVKLLHPDFTMSNKVDQSTDILSGSINDLSYWSSFTSWSGVVVAPHLKLSDKQLKVLMQMRLSGTPIYSLPNFYEILWEKFPPAFLKDTWFTFGDGFQLFSSRTSLKIKRIVDLVAASAMLLLLAPLMLVTAVAIKLESPGAIFYSQLRHGLNGQTFRVYKFRSMRQDAEKSGAVWAQKRDPRITRVGYYLRLLRIDELPQLWNILNGEMSLIGPRPERPEFDAQLAAEIPYYMLRYLIKPGLSGWAQVMYPYGASVEDSYEKLSYDFYYIKNYSIWLDLKIALKTMRIVLLGKGR